MPSADDAKFHFPESKDVLTIQGIDLAWGDRMPDGVCTIEINGGKARVADVRLVRGDDALVDYILTHRGPSAGLVLFDGPITCPNLTGSRPVDRLTHTLFGKFHAGAHPSNRTRCARPSRIADRLEKMGFKRGWKISPRISRLIEVYPHPAMIRLFGLPAIVKYKRGPAARRREEFARLQRLIGECATSRWPELDLSTGRTLLATSWTKNIEDQTDALFCALIGYQHWKHQGAKSEAIGDLKTGFILLPKAG